MTTRQDIYRNVLAFVEGVLSSKLEVTDLIRKTHFCGERLECTYNGHTLSVELSDNIKYLHTTDKLTVTFRFEDWGYCDLGWSGYENDRQVKRFVSADNSKLDIKKLLKSLDGKIQEYDLACEELVRVKERKGLTEVRVATSIGALRQAYPELKVYYSNEVSCEGIYIDVCKYEDLTYKLRGQHKKYSFSKILEIITLLGDS